MRYAANIVRLSAVGLVLAASLAMPAPATAANTPAEAANKKTVLDFYAALNAADASNSTKERIQAIAEKYLSPEYKQHTLLLPGPGTDREKLINMFQSRPAPPPAGGAAMPRQRTDAVMAEGDKVMLLTSRDMRDPVTGAVKPSYIFNMFTVKDGKLVEHWDVSAGMAPPPSGALPAPGLPPGR
jgi:predicted SnoaL-like aldol condensation-catalyzing enzyme